MCELFGISGDHRIKLNSYLKTLQSHSCHHPNGWGYASFECGDAGRLRLSLIKEAKNASESRLYDAMLEGEVRASAAMAHIRYATVGNVEYNNAHPFTERTESGRAITLVHNGTIFHAPSLSRYLKRQSGDTDSERILLYLVDLINGRERTLDRELTARERQELIDRTVTELAPRNKLNLLISDGDCLYAHTNCAGTLRYLRKDGVYLIATEPLSEEDWQPFPFCRVLAFRDGAPVYEGTAHTHEYIQNDDDLKNLYLAYACL